MSEIRLLPKEVSELVAAGEVVERPASVIKELMENCVDAGARSMTIEIKNGGLTFMRVTDDGCGIAPDEVATAFLRHATSKIATVQDLDSIGTLGFRGEALASVCAVSRVEIMTKKRSFDMGCRAVVQGGEVLECYHTGCPDGTTILVKDLFYNVPARLKFMKKDVTEGNAISSIVDRLALSHPEISVRFLRDGKEVIYTPGNGRLFSAVYAVLGKEFAASLSEVGYRQGMVEVTGYVSKPYAAQASRLLQICFINGRYVKSKTVMAALEQAFKNNIPSGKFPACVLFIKMPYTSIDVNIHPTKTEVRFDDERPVFDAVYYAVKTAFDGNAEMPKVRLESFERVSNQQPATVNLPFTFSSTQEAEKQYKNIGNIDISYEDELPLSRSEAVNNVPQSHIVIEEQDNSFIRSVERTPSVESCEQPRANFIAAEEMPVAAVSETYPQEQESALEASALSMVDEQEKESPKSIGEIRLFGELFTTYVIFSLGSELLLMDKHAAHERILFEQLKAELGTISGQMLLEPLCVKMSGDEMAKLLASSDLLAGLGFEIEEFGSDILMRQIPPFVSAEDAEGLLYELAHELLGTRIKPRSDVLDDILHSVACKAAIKAGKESNPAELLALAAQVMSDPAIRYCPHGRPVVIALSKNELDKRFGRV